MSRTIVTRLAALVWLTTSIAVTNHALASDSSDSTDSHNLVNPSHPGPDLPPSGRSLFDSMFLRRIDNEWAYQIPYPFEQLLRQIGIGFTNSNGESAVKTLLIPYGRSFRRGLRHHNPFQQPRILVAIDREVPTGVLPWPMLLKDRFYLAYDERTQSMDVITYNQWAGRFEFQVVENYSGTDRPSVRYANRTMCVSCHQNGGPIFPRSWWGESNYDREIFERLSATAASFHGISVTPYTEAPSIDSSTDRANLLPIYDLTWRELCDERNARDMVRCRAGIFSAMLQYRLGTYATVDTRSELFWDYFVPISVRKWPQLWPGGLRIPDADIPNRRPLRGDTPEHISPNVDPLRPRKARTHWDVSYLPKVVRGLAATLPDSDIARLDRRLFDLGLAQKDLRWRFRGPCEFTNHGPIASGFLLTVECTLSDGMVARNFTVIADVMLQGNRIVSATLNSILMSDGMRFAGLRHVGATVRAQGDYWEADLGVVQYRNGLHTWLPDGTAVQGVALKWARSVDPHTVLPVDAQFMGTAVLTLVPGYEELPMAIASMVEREETEGDLVFGNSVYQPTQLLRALFTELDLTSTPWCCDFPPESPPPEVYRVSPRHRVDAFEDVQLGALADGLYPHCGACHANHSQHPAGFLAGSPAQVARNLQNCAERIFVRLKMWDVEARQRTVTPMPPEASIGTRSDVIQWRESTDLRELIVTAGELVEQLSTKPVSLEGLTSTGHDGALSCLAGT